MNKNNFYFKKKIQRQNITTKIRAFKSHPERGITIESNIDKIALDNEEYGKEIFLVIKSLEIKNQQSFYTDVNGLYPKKRIMKAYESEKSANFSRNFFPITNFLYIEDEETKIRMTYHIKINNIQKKKKIKSGQ